MRARVWSRAVRRRPAAMLRTPTRRRAVTSGCRTPRRSYAGQGPAQGVPTGQGISLGAAPGWRPSRSKAEGVRDDASTGTDFPGSQSVKNSMIAGVRACSASDPTQPGHPSGSRRQPTTPKPCPVERLQMLTTFSRSEPATCGEVDRSCGYVEFAKRALRAPARR